ncbi:hypothetical protein [Pseudoclavibacter sp. VKM Ac-2867]|uniref:hypothetical protein n=1 Tax=Pseudoclavibacter sp. VKM Ac-2867 TaxID=2783829 RepID=UPI00188BC7E0|nr:hypothetical protein [Pseudoclavibacter sp. VKM Ac-2867]MBF4459767.1 hypothetical protein [Pseudoclavibacter sp. VKM Ac-2867]
MKATYSATIAACGWAFEDPDEQVRVLASAPSPGPDGLIGAHRRSSTHLEVSAESCRFSYAALSG